MAFGIEVRHRVAALRSLGISLLALGLLLAILGTVGITSRTADPYCPIWSGDCGSPLAAEVRALSLVSGAALCAAGLFLLYRARIK